MACQRNDKDFPIPEAIDGSVFSLSSDSIIIDTLASEQLSATYNIRLYNTSSEVYTIQKIKLLDGTKGFSINVDGSFGTDFQKLSMEGRDSLYIFVRAYLPLGKEDKPTEVKDIIEIQDDSGRSLQVPIVAIRQNVDHVKDLIITKELIRSSKRPWFVHDSIIIEQGAKLKLLSPSQIWFDNKAYMRVKGVLEIEGTAAKPVRFCGTRWDRFIPLVPYSRLTGQWGGIFFDGEAQAKLSYLHLLNASFGLYFSPNKHKTKEDLSAKLQHCRIHNIKGAGINADMGYFTIEDSEISNTLGSCLSLSGGVYQISRSSIINYYDWPDIRSDQSLIYKDISQSSEKSLMNSSLTLEHCVIDGEMPVYNNISNNSQRGGEVKIEILGEQGSKAKVRLKHCYLRSVALANNQYIKVENILYRTKETKTEELYLYLGENKDKKKDYRYDFRPKDTAPFIGLGEDGSTFKDLDGKVRESHMTYGAYRSK